MPPKVSKKRKSSDEENLELTSKCRHCEKDVPNCRIFQCSRSRHFACVDCLRIAAENIVFEGAKNFDHERKGITCYKSKCSGIFPYDKVKIHLIPEMAVALNAVMTKFNCAVCFLDYSMKDGITCQKVERNNEDEELHTFCVDCIKEFAATDEAILAHGGVGLGCMQNGCEHALMLNQIKSHLSKAVIKRLEDRVMEENIGHAEIQGLQRCQKCNYAVEVIGGRYFVCVCGHKQCVICANPFDNKHTNLTCQKKKSKSEQTLDDQINSVVVRFCHKCNLQFVKSSGCNFMKCRCGSTQCYICREKNITNDHFCKCPGLQEECKCSKRCRQFADANHIDAHRIELLKSQINAGKKVSNDEILQSMPKINIPEYEDSDDDDDDDNMEDDDEDDFDVDSDGQDIFDILSRAPRRGTLPFDDDFVYDSDGEPTIQRRVARRESSSSEDSANNPLRRLFDMGSSNTVRGSSTNNSNQVAAGSAGSSNPTRARVATSSNPAPTRTFRVGRTRILNRNDHLPFQSSGNFAAMGTRVLRRNARLSSPPPPPSSSTLRQPLRGHPILLSGLDSSDEEIFAEVHPNQRRAVRRNFSVSSEDSGGSITSRTVQSNQTRVRNERATSQSEIFASLSSIASLPLPRRRPLAEVSLNQEPQRNARLNDSSVRNFPAVNINADIVLESSDEEEDNVGGLNMNRDVGDESDPFDLDDSDVVEDSDEEVLDNDSDNGTIQLESSDEEEVIAADSLASSDNESDSDEIFESANESSTQASPAEALDSDEDESDSDVPVKLFATRRVVVESSSSDDILDTSEEENDDGSSSDEL